MERSVLLLKRIDSQVAKQAFIKSLPILCSYLFVGIAYGIMMAEHGLGWYWSFTASLLVYTGAFQFVLITFISGGASLLTVAVTGMLMNSRQSFYSITFLKDFKHMGRRMLYMIFSMSDETYAVNCTLDGMDTREKEDTMYLVARLSRFYWISASVLGGVVGQLIPFQMEGIDFCMTALFITIFIDQWQKTKNHLPALSGLIIAVLCLLIFGQSSFILPSLLITSAILILSQKREKEASA